jgi:hypothetical protein
MYTVYATLGIWAVVVLLFGITVYFVDRRRTKKRGYAKTDGISGGIAGFGFVTFLIALLFGFGTAHDNSYKLPTKTVVGSVKALVAMHSVDGIEGEFFLGCGTIDGATKYHVYVRNADGSMSPDYVYADPSVHIVEDKNLHGQGFWRVIESVRDTSVPAAKWALTDDGSVESHDEFDVPVGTVVQNFSVK